MKYKIFGYIFLAFVAVVIIGGVYYWQYGRVSNPVQNTPDETAGWKTYTNTQYGFEMKYPSDWKIEDYYGEGVLNSPETIKNNAPSLEVCRSLNSNPGKDCPSYYDMRVSGMEGLGIPSGTKQINLGTNNFYISSDSQPTYYIKGPKIIIAINTASEIGAAKAHQILSTFKFTDSVDTSTWKTYTNTEYGVELRYPPMWKVQEKVTGFGFWINPPDFKMPSSGTVNPYFSFDVTAHMYLGDEKPIIKSFGTRTGYVYVKDQSVYFPAATGAGGYFIKLYTLAGVNESNQILSTFKFTDNNTPGSATSYKECVSQPGSKMLETYPEQCVTKDGKTFPNPDQHL